MKIDVDITDELETVIQEQIAPAFVVSGTPSFVWNLKAQTLTAQVKLANGVCGEKAVSVSRRTENKTLIAIGLAFAFVEHVKKEGKRQVAKEAVKAIQDESAKNGTDKLTEAEIDAEIKAARNVVRCFHGRTDAEGCPRCEQHRGQPIDSRLPCADCGCVWDVLDGHLCADKKACHARWEALPPAPGEKP